MCLCFRICLLWICFWVFYRRVLCDCRAVSFSTRFWVYKQVCICVSVYVSVLCLFLMSVCIFCHQFLSMCISMFVSIGLGLGVYLGPGGIVLMPVWLDVSDHLCVSCLSIHVCLFVALTLCMCLSVCLYSVGSWIFLSSYFSLCFCVSLCRHVPVYFLLWMWVCIQVPTVGLCLPLPQASKEAPFPHLVALEEMLTVR